MVALRGGGTEDAGGTERKFFDAKRCSKYVHQIHSI